MFSENRDNDRNKYDDILMDFSLHSDIDIDKNTFLAIEDIDNRQWICYSSYTGTYTIKPFGHITADMIYECLSRLKNDVHHNKLMEWYDEIGFEYDAETGEKDAEFLKPYILQLQDVILNLGKYRKDRAKAEMKATLLEVWKIYRNAKHFSTWKDIINLSEDTEENHKKKLGIYTQEDIEDIKKIVKVNHASAIELNNNMYNIHIKKFFCFCDYVTFYDNNNVPLIGRGYIARTPGDMFAADLYHVLVSGLAGTPRLCPRCGHIFYPNNKSKYCDDCKKDSPSIRNEKRRQSVRYYHKKVYDKITQSKKYDDNFRNAFMNESNYYWDIVQGKEVIVNPLYKERIKTETQYKKWLEKKLISL